MNLLYFMLLSTLMKVGCFIEDQNRNTLSKKSIWGIFQVTNILFNHVALFIIISFGLRLQFVIKSQNYF